MLDQVVATLGAFDGVHKAHQALLGQVVDRARHLGTHSLCVTFDPHPDIVLYPERKLTYLTDREEKERIIRSLGIDEVMIINFTRELSMLRAEEFIDLLVARYTLAELWLGPDAAFGRGRSGTVGVVAELARERGFALHVVPPFRLDQDLVSSTFIRNLLAEGQVEDAGRLLGRCYALSGQVVPGAGRGRSIGFPTANVAPPPQAALPADGVYAVWVRLEGERRGGVVNLGGRPTFGETERLLEVHLLDFEGDLYGRRLTVEFVRRIRGVEAFPSVDALVAQIDADARSAREMLREAAERDHPSAPLRPGAGGSIAPSPFDGRGQG